MLFEVRVYIYLNRYVDIAWMMVENKYSILSIKSIKTAFMCVRGGKVEKNIKDCQFPENWDCSVLFCD